jgi:peroxiredoxin family protein
MTEIETRSSASLIDELSARVATLERKAAAQADPNAMTILVMSDAMDKLTAAFTIASAAAACNTRVVMFFSFWAAAALKKPRCPARPKTFVEMAFGWMLPGGFQRRALSKLDMFGLGRRLMKRQMKRKDFPTLDTLVETAKEAGVEIQICQPTLDLMGIHPDDLIDYPGLKPAGAATFLNVVSRSGANFFIS